MTDQTEQSRAAFDLTYCPILGSTEEIDLDKRNRLVVWNLAWLASKQSVQAEMKEMVPSLISCIIEDLTSRRGFRQTWEEIDDDVRIEIISTWRRLALARIERGAL